MKYAVPHEKVTANVRRLMRLLYKKENLRKTWSARCSGNI